MRFNPSHVIAFGQADSRERVGVEKVGINWLDSRIPDNDGTQPTNQPILPGQPEAYFSSLPVKEMVSASLAVGTPTELSLSAGSYVCNFLMYRLLHATCHSTVQAGFIHLPLTTEMATERQKGKGLKLETMATGVSEMVAACWKK